MLDMPPDKTSKQVLKDINKAREDILRPPKDQNTCETGKDEDQAFSAFFKAPSRALQDKRLATRPRTFIILCALCQFIGPTGYCYPKQAVTIGAVLTIFVAKKFKCAVICAL